jgi:hypothetical protein
MSNVSPPHISRFFIPTTSKHSSSKPRSPFGGLIAAPTIDENQSFTALVENACTKLNPIYIDENKLFKTGSSVLTNNHHSTDNYRQNMESLLQAIIDKDKTILPNTILNTIHIPLILNSSLLQVTMC